MTQKLLLILPFLMNSCNVLHVEYKDVSDAFDWDGGEAVVLTGCSWKYYVNVSVALTSITFKWSYLCLFYGIQLNILDFALIFEIVKF